MTLMYNKKRMWTDWIFVIVIMAGIISASIWIMHMSNIDIRRHCGQLPISEYANNKENIPQGCFKPWKEGEF